MSDIILPIHLISLAFVFWNVVNADHMGFNWVRGKTPTLDKNTVKKYHYGSWIGLLLMITTGLILFWPMRDYLLARQQFLIKMVFVVALIVNGLVIGNLQERAITNKFEDLSFKEKLPLFISGAVSTISWLGAFTMAFFLF